jgi:hypothetical protein
MTIDDLAKSIGKGFRAVALELRAQRKSNEDVRAAVVGYSTFVEERDGRRVADFQKLSAEVAELRKRLSQ